LDNQNNVREDRKLMEHQNTILKCGYVGTEKGTLWTTNKSWSHSGTIPRHGYIGKQRKLFHDMSNNREMTIDIPRGRESIHKRENSLFGKFSLPTVL
jgi:hypothetical protein